ncbi:cytochrome P450 2J4-like [Biomphalaria glabrata]|uniref:Cytochrome P450 2J4-like n=1 Tax=Biomphalaria glabrata TaxID=6526 RepID=A0A9W3AJJ7_BIOGL|nr:cytochrome P450 2J4-like [Biomphalaria glabrata]
MKEIQLHYNCAGEYIIMSLIEHFIADHYVSVIIASLVFVLLRKYLQTKKSPPGPWSLPWIGHLFLLNKGDTRNTFRELRAQYGDLVSLSLGSLSILVVSGLDMLHEVFVKHGKYFDKRPQMFTTVKVGQGKAVVNASGHVWREHRTFLVSNMKEIGISHINFEANVLEELQPFLQLLASTEGKDFDPRLCLQTATSNIICSISFGKRFDYEDPDFKDILEIVESNMKLVGATAIVNYFPFLEFLPGDMFKCKQCLNNVDKVQRILQTWIDRHKLTLEPSKPRDIIDLYMLDMQQKVQANLNTSMSEDQLLKLIGDLFVGGTETTATTLRWTLVFLVHHPEVQERIYSEIMTTLNGRTQLSVLDQRQMPFTSAVTMESQRLGDIAPFSLPHSNTEPVRIGSYVIPAGTLVIPNVNSVHLDPELWANPSEFRPDRFLSDDGSLVKNSALMPFFIGQRVCPGQSLAKLELFHFITSIVQHFHILPSLMEGLPQLHGHLGLTYIPLPHTLRFVARCQSEINPS